MMKFAFSYVSGAPIGDSFYQRLGNGPEKSQVRKPHLVTINCCRRQQTVDDEGGDTERSEDDDQTDDALDNQLARFTNLFFITAGGHPLKASEEDDDNRNDAEEAEDVTHDASDDRSRVAIAQTELALDGVLVELVTPEKIVVNGGDRKRSGREDCHGRNAENGDSKANDCFSHNVTPHLLFMSLCL